MISASGAFGGSAARVVVENVLFFRSHLHLAGVGVLVCFQAGVTILCLSSSVVSFDA